LQVIRSTKRRISEAMSGIPSPDIAALMRLPADPNITPIEPLLSAARCGGSRAINGAGDYQCRVPGVPLNGPTTREVIQPP
jgi:hypothetical protein